MIKTDIDTHIIYIREGMDRIEKKIESWLKKKASIRVEHAMKTFVWLICVVVIGAVISNVVVSFNQLS